MAYQLSAQSEQFLASIVACGQYTSKEAALEAAVAALREKSEPPPDVPDEHVESVEEAIVSAQEGRLRELTTDDWSRLRQVAHEVSSRDSSSGH